MRKYLRLAINYRIPEIRHAWRSGLIVVSAFIVSVLILKAQNPEWIILTAFVSSQASLGSTMKKAKQRLVGNGIGCLLGVLISFLFNKNLVIVFIVFLLTIIFSIQYISKSYTVYTSVFTLGLILLLLLLKNDVKDIAILRLEDVLIGAGIGTVGSIIFWPDFAIRLFEQDVLNVYKNLLKLFHVTILNIENQKTIEDFNKQKIESSNANQVARSRILEMYYEFGIIAYPLKKYEKLILTQERIHYVILLIFQSIQCCKDYKYSNEYLKYFKIETTKARKYYLELVHRIPAVRFRKNETILTSESLFEISGDLVNESELEEFKIHEIIASSNDKQSIEELQTIETCFERLSSELNAMKEAIEDLSSTIKKA